MKHKELTCTFAIEEALRNSNDFLRASDLVRITHCSVHQVTTTLHQFKLSHVADTISDGNGLWWYALDKVLDTRHSKIEERTPESKPRRPRATKKKV